MNDFNQTRLGPDDPRLTAFALGELEGEENTQVAAAVAADPALQAAVEEIRDTAARLTAALEVEPMPEPAPPVRIEPYHTVRPARIFRLPYWGMAALAAAACLTLVLVWREGPHGRRTASPAVAEAGGEASGGAGGAAGGRVQPSNHVDMVFPAKTAEVAEASAGADDNPPWGQVLPNPSAAGAPASERVAADLPGRTAKSRATPGAPGAAPVAQIVGTGEVLDNDYVVAAREARSSFPVEVSGASYADVRRLLALGRRPPPADVRIEELVNAFTYDYAAPQPTDPAPFAASLEVASAPWAPTHRLVRIGLKGREAPGPGAAAPAVIAKEVRVQVEFNPALVHAYRLLGYEHRPVNTREAAGEIDGRDIAAGRTVTALYEVIPVGVVGWKPAPAVGRMGYQDPAAAQDLIASARNSKLGDELLIVRIHYEAPGDATKRRQEFPLVDRGTAFTDASADFKFAAAVAGFGLILRESPHRGAASLAAVSAWATEGTDAGAGGPRAEFIALVKRAEEVLAVHG